MGIPHSPLLTWQVFLKCPYNPTAQSTATIAMRLQSYSWPTCLWSAGQKVPGPASVAFQKRKNTMAAFSWQSSLRNLNIALISETEWLSHQVEVRICMEKESSFNTLQSIKAAFQPSEFLWTISIRVLPLIEDCASPPAKKSKRTCTRYCCPPRSWVSPLG